MMKRLRTTIMLLAGVGLISFWIGRWSYSKDVAIYKDQGIRVAVHREWPTSGLPLAEYRMLLITLRAGNTNGAIESLEGLLDTTVLGAMHRRTHLSASDAAIIDKVLSSVARYRKQFPRPLSVSIPLFEQSPVSRENDINRTSDKQLEVVRFLDGFKMQNTTN